MFKSNTLCSTKATITEEIFCILLQVEYPSFTSPPHSLPLLAAPSNPQTNSSSPPPLLHLPLVIRRVSYGVRFYYLIREGLLLHPNLNLVETPTSADIILYLPESAAWDKSECNRPEYASKLVVLDESDGSHIMEHPTSPWNLMYFKRSYIHRHKGVWRSLTCSSFSLSLLRSSKDTWVMSPKTRISSQ